jgi:putative NADPH-quinone reductase
MSRRIAILDGHPDPRAGRLVHALADAYAEGAQAAGHEIGRISVGTLDFPLLRTAEDFQQGEPPHAVRECQRVIAHADHLLIVHPLWLGSMPALTKGLLEQALRPGFAFAASATGQGFPKRLLTGKTARVVVTMGMPALVYRLYFRAHGLKNLGYILRGCGFGPVRATVLGSVEAVSARTRARWLERMRRLGLGAR